MIVSSFPTQMAVTDDPPVWLRPNFHSSPSISQSINGGLAASGLSRDDIDLLDFYSCFPIVPKLAAHHLGLSLEGYSDTRPITLLGGLTSFGGAGNNYSMHVSVTTSLLGNLTEPRPSPK